MEREDHCIVCGRKDREGIFIFTAFVCRSCEQEMVTTEVNEDKYLYFIKQMRQIWLKQNA
ncbi:sigma factor G inhibitor Gin [Aneurinibacillus sp. Ricciae_BoGa-3]|uniref:sigma factor G inhibitor Gin n=1 Tax=Aneurinibacillus sp. Ricciae_BoGa-3 TaxID=3022697 RepID=UPI00234164A2|nr:sigma factor G inhibitor Gin [Aneurinibacillus sp. Ricciae_BoGa-3]WCK54609.1 sigma factor G inhibitor Gin [Aneurinibacillus sp. Ricciae_BoGa-3]